MNSSIACSEELQPLIVHESYGFVQTLNFNGITPYPPNMTCAWSVISQIHEIIYLKFIAIELDNDYLDELTIFDGPNANSSILRNLTGSSKNFSPLTTSGSMAYIRFVGSMKPKTIGFSIYFEKRPRPVNCSSDTFTCKNSYECFALKGLCDNLLDCEDGSDEENCPNENNNMLFFNKTCGNPEISPILDGLYIVGGTKAIPGSWAWQASMRLVDKEPLFGHQCGASLLNRVWVITAAHCFMHQPKPSAWKLHFGKYNVTGRDDNETNRIIQTYFQHPDFSLETGDNDIALIKLNAPLPEDNSFISPVCLPELEEEPEEGEIFYVTGWGYTMNTGYDYVLKQAKIPVINAQTCQEWTNNKIGKGMFCAGYEKGGRDACDVTHF